MEAWRNDLRVYEKDNKVRAEFLQYAKGKKSAAQLSPPAKRLYELDLQFQNTLLKHRMNPSSIYTWYPQRIDELQRWKKAGADMFNIIYIPSMSHLPIGVGDKCPNWFKQKYMNILRSYVPKLKKAGLLDNVYIYCFDEIPARQNAAAADMLAAVKKEFPEIPTMSTCSEVPELMKLIDIWVPGLFGYNMRKDKIKRPKKDIWPYVCNGPCQPYPNLFIEFSAQGHRLLTGFMPFKYQWGGFLYYEFLGWRNSTRVPGGNYFTPFKIIDSGPLTSFNGRGYGGEVNGDGFVFYPGPKGAMSSIRAKCLRDGLEDYEMLCLLKAKLAAAKAGEISASKEWISKTENTLNDFNDLFKAITDYTKNSENILQHRNRVGELLSEISR